MGVDFLDLVVRLESEFGIEIGVGELDGLFLRHDPPDVTAGQIYVLVCDKCKQAGIPIRPSAWNRVKLAIWRSCPGVRIGNVRKGTRLVQGLGFT